MAFRHPSKIRSRGIAGYRKDIDETIYFRSRWEANFARYLNQLKKIGKIFKWEYEPEIFWFNEIKRGTRSYKPDFKIWEKQDSEPYFIELKGYMDPKSKTKLKRMKKYYPNIVLKLIGANEYKTIEKKYSKMFPMWEYKSPAKLR